MEELRSSVVARRQGHSRRPSTSPISELLKALEPVAYSWATDDESPVRFGFIAEQVDKVLPQVIRGVNANCAPPGGEARPGQPRCGSLKGGTGSKGDVAVRGIVYQDLIALLTEVA